MTVTKFLKLMEKFEIQTYVEPKSVEELRHTHVPFSGSPQKHPFDPELLILVVDPYSSSTVYYEFKVEDVSYFEELPHIVNMEGEVVNLVRIWVKKMSVAVRCSPFRVMDTI